MVRRFVEQYTTGADASLIPFVIPGALWIYSVILAVRAPGLMETNSDKSKNG